MKGIARSIVGVALLLSAACASAIVAPPATAAPATTVAVPSAPPPTATVAAQPTAGATVTVDAAGLATFTSPELGISFTYLSSVDGATFDTEVQGNKVFVYSEDMEPSQGQFVEVFKKDPGQSLADALKAELLSGYSAEDCLVIDAAQVNAAAPASFSLAQIDVPRLSTDTQPDLNAKAQKCPAGYVAIGGLAFFAADSQHPNQFAFFSIGQYVIPSANQIPWQNTIQFLN